MQQQYKLSWMRTLLFTAMLPLGLAACGKGESVQEMVGLTRTGPDAFNVVARPPLSMPPEFELRPPAPVGTPGPGAPRMDEVARGLLTGDDAKNVETAVMAVGSSSLETTGERTLMEKFGVAQADPTIRDQLTTDQYFQPEQEEEGWLQGIIPSLRDQKKKSELDPIEEARKLREDEALKDAVQAPPEEFLKKAESAKKKAADAAEKAKDAAKDAVDDVAESADEAVVIVPEDAAEKAAEKIEQQTNDTTQSLGKLAPPTDAVKE